MGDTVIQGTVARFEPADQTGTVLLDDGIELPFGADAFALSGLRLLRLGQRLRLVRAADGTVTEITLITMV
jgi:hypothetical protein